MNLKANNASKCIQWSFTNSTSNQNRLILIATGGLEFRWGPGPRWQHLSDLQHCVSISVSLLRPVSGTRLLMPNIAFKPIAASVKCSQNGHHVQKYWRYPRRSSFWTDAFSDLHFHFSTLPGWHRLHKVSTVCMKATSQLCSATCPVACTRTSGRPPPSTSPPCLSLGDDGDVTHFVSSVARSTSETAFLGAVNVGADAAFSEVHMWHRADLGSRFSKETPGKDNSSSRSQE